jgi:hypothetical protein
VEEEAVERGARSLGFRETDAGAGMRKHRIDLRKDSKTVFEYSKNVSPPRPSRNRKPNIVSLFR